MDNSRIIKFRAWAYASKKMFYPDSDDGWELENGILSSLPNTILMQYTGLHDKNDKEIYEGDILYSDMSTPTEEHENIDITKGVVRFGQYDICEEYGCPMMGVWAEAIWGHSKIFNHPSQQYIESNGCISSLGLTSQMVRGETEVIGNIYENPELLEEDKLYKQSEGTR